MPKFLDEFTTYLKKRTAKVSPGPLDAVFDSPVPGPGGAVRGAWSAGPHGGAVSEPALLEEDTAPGSSRLRNGAPFGQSRALAALAAESSGTVAEHPRGTTHATATGLNASTYDDVTSSDLKLYGGAGGAAGVTALGAGITAGAGQLSAVSPADPGGATQVRLGTAQFDTAFASGGVGALLGVGGLVSSARTVLALAPVDEEARRTGDHGTVALMGSQGRSALADMGQSMIGTTSGATTLAAAGEAAGAAGALPGLGLAGSAFTAARGAWTLGKAAVEIVQLEVGAPLLTEQGRAWKALLRRAAAQKAAVGALRLAAGALGIAAVLVGATTPVGLACVVIAALVGLGFFLAKKARQYKDKKLKKEQEETAHWTTVQVRPKREPDPLSEQQLADLEVEADSAKGLTTDGLSGSVDPTLQEEARAAAEATAELRVKRLKEPGLLHVTDDVRNVRHHAVALQKQLRATNTSASTGAAAHAIINAVRAGHTQALVAAQALGDVESRMSALTSLPEGDKLFHDAQRMLSVLRIDRAEGETSGGEQLVADRLSWSADL